jgi:hypothetical protein
MNIIAFLLSTIILQCQGWKECDPSYTQKTPGGYAEFAVIQVGDEKFEFTYEPFFPGWYCVDNFQGEPSYCAAMGVMGFVGVMREKLHADLPIDALEIHVHYDHAVWLPIFQVDP